MKNQRTSPVRIVLLGLMILAVSATPGAAQAQTDPPPIPISAYDIATRDDLLFGYLLKPLMKGEVSDWPILGGLAKQVGDWVDQFVGARQIAGLITEAFPMEGQPAIRPLEIEVEQCAKILGLPRPAIYVRNSPFAQAYVTHSFDRDQLVLTSSLLALFEGRPEELRFVIGHELGHVRCGHLELKSKAFGLLSALQAVNVAVVPDKFQAVLPTLGLGRLYTWCRESEISADRAGLLCSGEPKIAYQAMMRLQHGLNADSAWIDPEQPDFDAEKVIKDFQRWQTQPFVKLILDLKRHVLVHPFVPERLAALKHWVGTGAYRELVSRHARPDDGQLIEIVKIQAFGLAPDGQTIDPYVIAFDKDVQVLSTATAPAARAGQWEDFKSTDKGVNQPREFHDGQPLFFEVWDDNTLSDTFVGGFVIYPDGTAASTDGSGNRKLEITARILWDWNEPQLVTRTGYARVTVQFLRRETSTTTKPSP